MIIILICSLLILSRISFSASLREALYSVKGKCEAKGILGI